MQNGNKIIKMKRCKSFSAYGRYLEVRNSLVTDPQILMRNTIRAQTNPMCVDQKQSKWIEGFDRTTDRSKLSPFQCFNTRDFGENANYDVKDNLIRTRTSVFPLKQEKEDRLNNLIFDREYQRGQKICKKLPNPESRNEHIGTVRDLQNFRKSMHSLDFSKQSDRKNTYIKKPVANEREEPVNQFTLTQKTTMTSDLKEPTFKMTRTHSFKSYTKRDFLSDKNLANKGAPFYSGADFHKIPLEKFKAGWKVVGQQSFDKSPKKCLSRYDATNDPFYTKLGYQSKDELVRKKTLVFDMSQQMPRQVNQVHSKYPIRLAI